MPSFLQNKFVRVGAIVIVVLISLPILLLIINFSFSSLNYVSNNETGMSSSGFLGDGMMAKNNVMRELDQKDTINIESSYSPPEPQPTGYTSGLENYETTDYSISARSKQFDELCSNLTTLKTDPQIHFKSLKSETNNCHATVFVTLDKVDFVLNTLSSYNGVEVTRHTESVTRHRQQIESQTSIINQQLASVNRSLLSAETQFDELAEFARTSNNATALSEAIRYKLENIDTLTQRKIRLTTQLNQLYQQATDLEERLNVVQFNVNISRFHSIHPNENTMRWSNAWEQLKYQFTETLIGLSTNFLIFLLWTFRITIYLLVLIVTLRGLWKFIKIIWNRW